MISAPVKSVEFRRVFSLPRRDWKKLLTEDMQNKVNSFLRTPEGEQTLRPVQIAALIDSYEQRGLFGSVGVGQGKTHISLLIPTIVKAERPVLFVPASLRDQTLALLPEFKKHWKISDNLKLFSYAALSRPEQAELLQELNPDIIICDECHKLKNRDSARTRRFLRFMSDNPHILNFMLSGTITKNSLLDYEHLIRLCLREKSPLPQSTTDLIAWDNCLSPYNAYTQTGGSTKIGALKEFCEDKNEARAGFRKRLSESPGVICTDNESGCDASILIRTIEEKEAPLPAEVVTLLDDLLSKWLSPAGDELTEALEVNRIGKQLLQGYFYTWNWPNGNPDLEWLAKRKAWNKFVRSTLGQKHLKLDSPKMVENACKEGRISAKHWLAWEAVRGRFDPTKPENLKFNLVSNYIVDWLKSYLMGGGPLLMWGGCPSLCAHISKELSIPYFGAGEDKEILQFISGPGEKAILSIDAHSTGKNLQRFNHMLVLSPPLSAPAWEQLIGRVHRIGQKKDEITLDILSNHDIIRDIISKAQIEARYMEETTGQKQKLLQARITK